MTIIKQIKNDFKERNKLTLEKIEEIESSEIQEDKDLKEKITEEIKEKVSGVYMLPSYNYGNYGVYNKNQANIFNNNDRTYDEYDDYEYSSGYLNKKKEVENKDDLTDEEKENNDLIYWKLMDISNTHLLDDDSKYSIEEDEDEISEDFNTVNNHIAKERETIVNGFH